MGKLPYILVLIFIGLTVFESCKHEPILPVEPIDTTTNPIDTGGNDTTINPVDTSGVPCNPDTVYFLNDVLPLLNTFCAKSGCHDAGSHQDGVILNNYSNIMNTADVEPFDLDGSDLYEVITDPDPDKHMPPFTEAQLSAEQIQMIATWIMQGAQNNACNPNYGGCDTVNITYALDIQPIIQNKCQGCHNNSLPSDGINLSTHQGVINAQLDNGRLEGAVNHTSGYTPMPYNQAKLPECEVKKLNAWINAGMP